MDEKDFLEEHLRHFCEEASGSLSEFDSVFYRSFLLRIENAVKILQSKNGYESVKDVISPEDFKIIADKVVLDFLKSNKEVFCADEEVVLDLTIKNV